MSLAQKAVKVATKPLPNVISPHAHFVADYLTAGAFLAASAGFWHINKRASIGALICGAADLLIASLTTRPGGPRRALGFRTHGRIDMGLAAMTATMPEFMGIEDSPQARLFLVQSIGDDGRRRPHGF